MHDKGFKGRHAWDTERVHAYARYIALMWTRCCAREALIFSATSRVMCVKSLLYLLRVSAILVRYSALTFTRELIDLRSTHVEYFTAYMRPTFEGVAHIT